MINLQDVYAAMLAGVAQYKNEKEIWWEDHNEKITIEIIDDERYIKRNYRLNNHLQYEFNYRNDLLHGTRKWWHSNGQLWCEEHWKNGHVNGVTKVWYKNGKLNFEKHYKNDKLHGVKREWFINGDLESETFWENGNLIRIAEGHENGLL